MERRKADRRKNTSGDGEPTLFDILMIVYRRFWLFAAVTVLPTAASYVLLSQNPKLYGAKASVLLETQEVKLAGLPEVMSNMEFDNLTVPTEVQVISSPALCKQTIAAMGLRADAEGRLAAGGATDALAEDGSKAREDYETLKAFMSDLEVKQQGTSRVIDISFRAHDPQLAADVVNTHARIYLSSKERDKRALSEKIDRWLTEQISTLKAQNLAKSMEVQQFRARNGMAQGENVRALIDRQISDLAAKILETETRVVDLQARSEILKTSPAQSLSEVVDSALIQALKTRASAASQALQSMRGQYGERHPDVIAARKELAQIEGDIAREIQNIKKSLENELSATLRQKALLDAHLKTLEGQSEGLQEKIISLQALQQEEQAGRKLLDNLMARSEEIKSQLDLTRPNVTIVSSADIPQEPMGSKKLLIVVAVLAGSGFAAFLLVFALEMGQRGIRTREEIKKLSGLELIGALPRARLPISGVIQKERSAFIEEIKRLLIHINSEERGKTILFTASRRGEGKSTLAAAVAYYMNNIGLKTLLIDADTLDPVIAGVTMTPSSPGLFEMLSGRQAPEKAYTRDRHGLCVMPSGERTASLSDLILSGRLEAPLEKLKAQFDFIIFDSASALSVSDAEVLSALADQTVLVLEWAGTPREEFVKAAEILRKTAKNRPCVVFNKVKLSEIESLRVY